MDDSIHEDRELRGIWYFGVMLDFQLKMHTRKSLVSVTLLSLRLDCMEFWHLYFLLGIGKFSLLI